MNLILTVIEIVAPVFLLGALGFTWTRLGWDYPVAFITRLAMTLAVPCLIFTALQSSQIDPVVLSGIAIASVLAYALIAVALFGLCLVLKLERRTYLAPMVFGNTGNLGLPLALFAFGTDGLSYGVAVLAVTTIGLFTIGLLIVSGASNPARVLREPMVIATVLGALFLAMGWSTPGWLTNSLDLLGQMAIPLMLLTLGVAVGRLHPGQLLAGFGLSAVRVLICAAAGVAAGLALGLPEVPFAVLVVQMITPVPVTSYLLAEKYDAGAEQVAGLVVTSTLLAVVTLPIALALLV
ncbi:AEC family transporter [Aliiruegeria haliotis]|uniref:AEC family transporter n=1 Tax=Aliiruegeria haliotis TaxID=1280846 RepID=UPI000D078C17|nr:AEC family transporter [Aliiruegeria haliotis]